MTDTALTGAALQAPPPGWYRDPGLPDTERWWTGARWSEHTRTTELFSGSELIVPRSSSWAGRSLFWGIVAVVIPIAFVPGVLAVVFGAIALPRERNAAQSGRPARVGRARAGLVLGVVALTIGVLIVVLGSAFSSASTGCGC